MDKSRFLEIEVLLDGSRKGGLWHGTDHTLLFLAILEEENSRNAPDTVLGGYVGAVVRIELVARDLASVLLGELVDHWGYHLAGPAPRGPELHQYRVLALDHEAIPARVRHHFHCINTDMDLSGHQPNASKASHRCSPSLHLYPVRWFPIRCQIWG